MGSPDPPILRIRRDCLGQSWIVWLVTVSPPICATEQICRTEPEAMVARLGCR